MSSAYDHGVPSVCRAQMISPRCGLHRQHEVDRALDDGPHRVEEPTVARDEEVMPHTRGHVGAHVRVELVILDPVSEVVVVPRAVLELVGDQPVVGAFGLGTTSTDGERHRRFDVVPRVRVAAGMPEDEPGRELIRRDRVDRHHELIGAQDTFDFGDARHGVSGLRAYTTRLLPSTGLRTRSAMRVGTGASVMSHSRSLR